MKMTRFVTLGFVSSIAVLAVSTSAFAAPSPNPSITPGMTDPRVTQATIQQTICSRERLTTARSASTRVRNQVYATYHIKQRDRAKYVIDHLLPVEVGGTNSLANLWPEPKHDAKTKHRLGAQMHAAVCSGRLTLAGAQAIFMGAPAVTTSVPTTAPAPTTAPPTTEPPTTESPTSDESAAETSVDMSNDFVVPPPPVCLNSFDPQCGAFHWEPAPTNQPVQIDSVVVDPPNPIAGQPVTVTIHWTDPDADNAAITSTDGAFGTLVDDSYLAVCSEHPTGAWSLPASHPGSGTLEYRGQVPVAGTFPWTIRLTSWSSTQTFACGGDPYRSYASVSDLITVRDLFPSVTP